MLAAADRAISWDRWLAGVRWRAIIAYAEAAAVAPQPARATVAPPVSSGVSQSSGVLPCGGGDYPPCYVAFRESRNRYDAYNPTGCDGGPCYGRWQFSGQWGGKLGLPLDLSTATPAQQDEAARLLWNHGAGCSNWNAC